MINQNWVLLDSESTVNIFSNKKFLKNIRRCDTEQGLRVHRNGRFQDTCMIGDLPGFGPVWYKKGSLANILLSLAAVRKICRITMDTLEEMAIVVHKHNGNKMIFWRAVTVCTTMTLKVKPHQQTTRSSTRYKQTSPCIPNGSSRMPISPCESMN
jgi:hypothetical protein